MSFFKRLARKINSAKVIVFRPESEVLDETGYIHPRPAKHYIPDWYKKIPSHVDRNNDVNPRTQEKDHTVKGCVPILDAFTSGYIQELSMDIDVQRGGEGAVAFHWPRQNPWEPVRAPRHPAAMKGFVHPDGYDSNPYLWIQPFEFNVPKGYSILITHPFNRYDLPFLTMSAIIDVDVFPQRAEITFYLKSNFSGVIEKGTPLFQVIPFKREKWESETAEYNNAWRMRWVNLSRNVFGGAYKKNFWHKKEFNEKPQPARCPVTGATEQHGDQDNVR